ncbi:hypothetical protein HHI36_015701, partial [Cryptolaemus montrouzieri]
VQLYRISDLTEHWLAKEEVSTLDIENLKLANYSARNKSGRGGTAVLIEDSLKYRKYGEHRAENRVVCGGTFATEHIDSLYIQAIGRKFTLSQSNLYRSQASELIYLLETYAFTLLIMAATWESACIDNIFVNFNNDSFVSELVDFVISDHLEQLIHIEHNIDNNSSVRKNKYS